MAENCESDLIFLVFRCAAVFVFQEAPIFEGLNDCSSLGHIIHSWPLPRLLHGGWLFGGLDSRRSTRQTCGSSLVAARFPWTSWMS